MTACGIAIRVRRAVLVLLAVLPGLSGCAGPSDEEQVSWQCQRSPDGRSWNCAQQRMRNGVAVGPVAAPEPGVENQDTTPATTRAGDAQRAVPGAEGSASATPVPAPEPTPKATWSGRLPGLQESQPRAEVAGLPVVMPELTVGSRAGPAPEPEPALARWEGAATERAVGAEAAVPSPTTAAVAAGKPEASAVSPEEAVVPPPARHAGSPRDSAATGGFEPAAGGNTGAAATTGDAGPSAATRQGPYTVQIGAFRSDADARAYLAQHRLDDLEVALEHRQSRGHEYSVLTFGRFATVRDATAAWRRIAAGRELDFWVRPAR